MFHVKHWADYGLDGFDLGPDRTYIPRHDTV